MRGLDDLHDGHLGMDRDVRGQERLEERRDRTAEPVPERTKDELGAAVAR